MPLPIEMRPVLLTTAAAVLLSTGACVDIVGADFQRYVDRQEKQFSVTGKPDVSLATFDGAIEIRPWDRQEVQLIVERRASSKELADEIEIHTDQQANRIVVDVKVPRHEGYLHVHHRSAKLIVSMPAESDVLAKSGDGAIDVEGIAGRIELRSGDGSIRARRLDGDVNVQTGDGSIRLEAVKGALRVNTGDGSIIADGTFTNVRARSGDGSIRIGAEPGSASSGDWDIGTGDGAVTVALPSGFNAEIDAHTGDGRIHLQDLTLTNVTGRIGRNTVRGRLGEGGSLVRIRSGDGSITLKRSDANLSTTLPAERP
jgi:DUF4097 and DUF4098 domain-containing protein YvlB